MIHALDQGRYEKLNERNIMMLKFLYSTGLRVSELSNLKINHFYNLSEGRGKVVLGKGGKSRHFKISKELA